MEGGKEVAGPRKARRRPVTFAVARRMALKLPGVVEGTSYGTPGFKVAKKFFFRLKEDGGTLALRIDFDTREALMRANPEAYFITDHYRGWPAILVRLSAVRPAELRSLLAEAWSQIAPKRLLAGGGRSHVRKS